MIAAGIDLGGTKIEAQVFAADWSLVARRRIDTPKDYPALVAAMADQIAWIDGQAPGIPVGVAAAGLVNPATGLALTANLAASGQPFPADIARAARPVTYVNDCSAFTLSEAIFGAARGLSPAVGLILGTGVGGGLVIDGRLIEGPAGLGGEFGHFALPAAPVMAHNLPILRCGCGRFGCTETYISGSGLARIAHQVTGQTMAAADIARRRTTDPQAALLWGIWLDIMAEVLLTLTLTLDPACIVLGGGMSQAEGIAGDLSAALQKAQLPGFAIPKILIAEGGDASGARGAAYAAHLGARHG